MAFENKFALLFLLVVVAVVIRGGTQDSFDNSCFQIDKPPSARMAGFLAINNKNDESKTIRKPNGKQCKYTLTRHHIIPKNIVIRFFNKAIGHDEHQVREGLTQFAHTLKDSVDVRYNSNRAFNDLNRWANAEIKDRIPEELFIVEPSGFDKSKLFHAYIIWIPCNWFEGPSAENRDDDPRGEFEINSAKIVGVDNLKTLKNIYDNMISYIRSPNDVEFFTRAVNDFKGLIQRVPEGYRMFNPNDWDELDNTGDQCKFNITKVNTEDTTEAYKNTELRRSTNTYNTQLWKDPFCLDTQQIILNGLTSGEWLYDNGVLWDLKEYDLVSAKKILNSVEQFKLATYNLIDCRNNVSNYYFIINPLMTIFFFIRLIGNYPKIGKLVLF